MWSKPTIVISILIDGCQYVQYIKHCVYIEHKMLVGELIVGIDLKFEDALVEREEVF